MTYLGVDTAARITAEQAQKLRDNGVSFVGRYLAPQGFSKALTVEEASVLRLNGLAILFCWEIGAESMRYGAKQGGYDAARAKSIAEALGVPSGTCIYFAADYNVPDSDLIQCEAYIEAAKAVLGSKYQAGVYGGERICDFLSSRGTVNKVWQCVAWTNVFIPAANVRQYAWQGAEESKRMAAATGIMAVDMDSTEDMVRAGLWMPKSADVHWYDDTVRWALKEGIVTEARPEDFATRAEVMQMIRNYNRRFLAEDDKTTSGLID